MPASLHLPHGCTSSWGIDPSPQHHIYEQRSITPTNLSDSGDRAVKLAMELSRIQSCALLAGNLTQRTMSSSSSPTMLNSCGSSILTNGGILSMNNYNCTGSLDPIDSIGLNNYGLHTVGSLEDLKSRSQNMTECVPVPTSEHVAEIVGRQGCKIKALRAKTNTYIKTPVRGEEPVFVVTGRKDDVSWAKREILSAADHFSQIRASRKNSLNSTLAFGQLVISSPGQTTVMVRVPYRVVGLVVGPKGATIKRIQQQTQTYIVTPSRDKEPIFEVTGSIENVEIARKEIEAHIAIRTGSSNGTCSMYSTNGSGFDGSNDPNDIYSNFGITSVGQGCHFGNKYAAPGGNSNGLVDATNMLLNQQDFNDFQLTLPSLQSMFDMNGVFERPTTSVSTNGFHNNGVQSLWSNGESSHPDSGFGHSPPFEQQSTSVGIWGGDKCGNGGIGNIDFQSLSLKSASALGNNPVIDDIFGNSDSSSLRLQPYQLAVGSRAALGIVPPPSDLFSDLLNDDNRPSESDGVFLLPASVNNAVIGAAEISRGLVGGICGSQLQPSCTASIPEASNLTSFGSGNAFSSSSSNEDTPSPTSDSVSFLSFANN